MTEPKYGSRSLDRRSLARWIDEVTPRHPNHHGHGVTFFDLSYFSADPILFNGAVDWAFGALKLDPEDVQKVAGPESRGYGLAGALAREYEAGHLWQRKPGKLPGSPIRESYNREYGSETLEMSPGCVNEGDGVVLVDDLIATGGSLIASGNLVVSQGGILRGVVAIVELPFLEGRQRFQEVHPEVPVHTLLKYRPGEPIGDTGCYEMVLIEE